MFPPLGKDLSGYPPKFMKWTQVFYNQISTCTINNGNISQFFNPSRGVRQGCPLWPLLFVITVKLLSIIIRMNPNISEILMENKVMKVSQFADDTLFSIMNNQTSINTIFKLLENFTKISGLKVNKDKTEIMLIGWSTSSDTPVSVRPYIKNSLKMLGVWV